MENQVMPEATGQKQETPSVVDNPDGTKTVRLVHPIKIGGAEQTEIILHRPKLGDLKALDEAGLRFGDQGLEIANPGSTIIKVVARLGNMHPEAAELIELEDMPAIVEALAGFFGASHLIGSISFGV